MKILNSKFDYLFCLAKYIVSYPQIQFQTYKAILESQKSPNKQQIVRLFDSDFARNFSPLVTAFNDSEINGTSVARWEISKGSVFLHGKIGTETAEYMERTPYCGLKLSWPLTLDLSNFQLLRVTARCNLPLRVVLRPTVTIAFNEISVLSKGRA